LGGAFNDSGVVVPGAAAVVGVPLLLAGCLRAERMST
jgi:NADH:ubiquinone oxidoreductase subunit B-like Fe-S oxidoreductase